MLTQTNQETSRVTSPKVDRSKVLSSDLCGWVTAHRKDSLESEKGKNHKGKGQNRKAVKREGLPGGGTNASSRGVLHFG